MTDAPNATPDYKDTVFLPRTDFPMKAGLPQKEPVTLARWQDQDLYAKLRDARRGREKFILHDGPPYANGDMHIGHALNHILKDMVVRTQTLKGKDAPYVPGWDCHGLPIEWKVEEQYRKKKRNKDDVPVEEFRAECRAYAQSWVDTQREQLKRLGINGDWDHPYLTMDFEAEATIVSELMKFAESGQLYRGAKPVMWSPVEKTALAEAEVEYEDIVSTQIDVAFEIVETRSPTIQAILDKGWSIHAVIWTTTPWTIPVNQAIAYGPEVDYVLFYEGGSTAHYLVAAELAEDFAKRTGLIPGPDTFAAPAKGDPSYMIHAERVKGADLAGTIARHPMAQLFSSPLVGEDQGGGRAASAAPETHSAADAAGPHPNPSPQGGGALAEFFLRPRPFLPGDFVTTESGTGLVHMAPDHGEDDFDLCKAHDIDPVFAVEGDGKYRADWAWLGGQGSVINPKFNAPDGPICSDLHAAGGLLAASADYKHSYPHSWRSKAKVIYRCTPQWFVPMDRPLKPSPLVGEGGGALAPEGEGRGAPAPQQTLSAAGATGPHDSFAGPHPNPSLQGGGATLRQTAMRAIADTRFVPEKGRNRIGSMVEGRPDWVLSRQRAWGVPITLFVNRKTGQYLCDPDVNARIVAGIRETGVDAWSDARAADYLGDRYDVADYERVSDILDVWFDAGCTHVFTLESGRWPDLQWPADLYLEGSDQHRGWFQSSLLESCGTRGRAPYEAVLTHGFTMDQKGMKMSKSLGNTISPLDLMRDYGADILRLWALSVDYTEDHRIGKEILAGVGDQYRKLRNTFRYLLGALADFDDSERVAVADMPELERYVLALLADMDAKLARAVDDFDFNTYVRLLADFANEDLSAFFFDIRKDCLYCDAGSDPKRRAYRTTLDIVFHALVRYAAPVLVFTAEEVWQSRYPDADSVHLLEWPELPNLRHSREGGNPADEAAVPTGPQMDPRLRGDDELVVKWATLREIRRLAFTGLEKARTDKLIRSSMEAKLAMEIMLERHALVIDQYTASDLAELFIVSEIDLSMNVQKLGGVAMGGDVTRTDNHKCGRCWRHLPEVTDDGALCGRCDTVLAPQGADA